MPPPARDPLVSEKMKHCHSVTQFWYRSPVGETARRAAAAAATPPPPPGTG